MNKEKLEQCKALIEELLAECGDEPSSMEEGEEEGEESAPSDDKDMRKAGLMAAFSKKAGK